MPELLKRAMRLIAVVVLLLLFAKCLIDVDSNWDTWSYHIPFAARLWHIIPESQYVFDPLIQQRFEGFPMLGEFLQGAFWRLTGLVQTTNLVAYFSFVGFIVFLYRYFNIPFYYSTLALLAVPLIQIHTAISYVDLPGNIFAAMFLLMIYLSFLRPRMFTRKNIFLMVLFSAMATNIKFFFLPIIVIGWVEFFINWYMQAKLHKWQVKKLYMTGLAVVVTLLVFASVIKNIIVYHEPLHGIQVTIAGQVLSAGEDFTYDVPRYLAHTPSLLRWVLSLIEYQCPWLTWSVSQHYPLDLQYQGGPADRMGGFFGLYVLFHLALFALIQWKTRDKLTLNFFLGISLLTAFLPMSFQLRYCMYWMIILIVLNLNWLLQKHLSLSIRQKSGILAGILVFFFVVTGATLGEHIMPRKHPLYFLHDYMVGDKLKKAPISDAYCVSGVHPYSILYTPYFNPELKRSYQIEDNGQDLSLAAKLTPGLCQQKIKTDSARDAFLKLKSGSEN